MDAIANLKVELPNGRVVELSKNPQAWWKTQDGSGYVDPKDLALDPDQPRKHYNEGRLAELTQSVAVVGVRESITVTPLSLCPWAKVAPEEKDSHFLIVSGHRRTLAARKAALPAVPVRVVIYEDEKDHRLDASLLNRNRDKLLPLEMGYEIVGLRQLGVKHKHISEAYGISTMMIHQRINLTKLEPRIQALIGPDVEKRRKLDTTTAGNLGGVKAPTFSEMENVHESLSKYCELPELPDENSGETELRFFLQHCLLAVIQKRNLKTIRAGEFIRKLKLELVAHGKHNTKSEPRVRREGKRNIIENWILAFSENVSLDYTPAEIRKAYELSSQEHMDEILEKMQNTSELLAGFAKLLRKIRDEKKPTHEALLRRQRSEQAQ